MAALAYARRGLPVFPIWGRTTSGHCACGDARCPDPAKHPVGRLVEHGLLEATTDAQKIRLWWRKYPQANIGIRTGAAAGIAIVDIDQKSGGEESLHGLERDHGAMPETWRVLTGGGGLHLYVSHPGGTVSNSTSEIAPGIDVRGDGGYVVAPPSIHISGRRYEWEIGHDPESIELTPPPSWFCAKKVELNGHAPFDTAMVLGGVGQGQRNDQIFKLAAKFRRADIPYEFAARLVCEAAANCAPPLEDEEAIKALNSAYNRYQPEPLPAEVILEDEVPVGADGDTQVERTIISALLLRHMDLPPIEWVLEGLIPRSRYAVLSGESGLGKSWWALALALCAAMGLEFLGRKTAPIRALYIDEENGVQEAQRRLRALADGFGIPAEADIPIDFVIDEGLKLGRAPDANWLIRTIEERDISLVITDSLIRVFDGDENQSKDAKAFHAVIDAVRRRTGVTWIMLQHLNKAPRDSSGQISAGDRLRGSSEWKAHADAHIQLRGADASGTIVVHPEKVRGATKKADFVYRMDGDTEAGEPVTLTLLGDTAAALGAQRGAASEAISILDMAGSLTVSELIGELGKLGISRRTAERGISYARKSGTVIEDRREGLKIYLRLRTEFDDA